jgi:hypothetical protein
VGRHDREVGNVLRTASDARQVGPPDGRRLALGAMLGLIGATVVILSILSRWTELARPWSFLIGFVGGVAGGAGAAISVCGLIGLRRARTSGQTSSDSRSL